MSSYITDFEGLYDPKRTFALTNWSDEDFTVNWQDPGPEGTGDNIYTLHAGEVKTYPMYLAYFILKNFVDREMYKASAKVSNNPDGSSSRARERAEMAVNNKDLWKPYEDKTMQEVIAGKESPEVTAMRAKIRAELIIEEGEKMKSGIDLNSDGTEKEEFASLPRKAGRPRKTTAEVSAGI